MERGVVLAPLPVCAGKATLCLVPALLLAGPPAQISVSDCSANSRLVGRTMTAMSVLLRQPLLPPSARCASGAAG